MSKSVEERLLDLEKIVVSKSEIHLTDPQNDNVKFIIKVEDGNLQTIKEVKTIQTNSMVLNQIGEPFNP